MKIEIINARKILDDLSKKPKDTTISIERDIAMKHVQKRFMIGSTGFVIEYLIDMVEEAIKEFRDIDRRQ